jgi:hemoglobin-like flavoprotein
MKSISTTHAAVIESYHRCDASGGFFDSFYEVFLAKLPEIPPRFANTDMQKQKQVVMASVLMVLRLRTGDPAACHFVMDLARSHNRRGHNIPPRLYPLWLDALCEAVQKHDPEVTPELESEWRKEMRPGIEMMIAAY